MLLTLRTRCISSYAELEIKQIRHGQWERIADAGYKLFSGTMMLLTVYGGYLCVLRAQRFMQKRKQLELAAQNESAASETIKE